MLILVQFPIIDARLFCGIARRNKPVWPNLQRDADFVPGFGVAKNRREFNDVPPQWRDDANYVSARWALRLKGVAEKRSLTLPGAGTDIETKLWVYRPEKPASAFCFTPAFRRLFSDGNGFARIEIGFWVLGGEQVDGHGLLNLVRDVMGLEVEVRQLNGRSERRPLREQTKNLAKLYYQSTRLAPTNSPSDETEMALVRPGVPAVFVDDRILGPSGPRVPRWLEQEARSLGMPSLTEFPDHAAVVPAEAAGAMQLAYTSLKTGGTRIALWMLRGAPPAKREAVSVSRNLRRCLPRLHSMRQALDGLLRLAGSGAIPYDAGDDADRTFEKYLDDLAGQVLQPKAAGAEQAEILAVVSVYDLGDGGIERDTLKIALDKLPMTRALRARVEAATRTRFPAADDTEHDVFLCHNSADKAAIEGLRKRLEALGIHSWLDARSLRRDQHQQPQIEAAMEVLPCIAIFLGPSGIGKWQELEMQVASTLYAKRKRGVLVALLPGVLDDPKVPLFHADLPRIDLRKWNSPGEPGLTDLVAGIFGQAPEKVDGALDSATIVDLRKRRGIA